MKEFCIYKITKFFYIEIRKISTKLQNEIFEKKVPGMMGEWIFDS